MAERITIRAGSLELEAELNDSATAQAIRESLPIRTLGNRWGGEIYFAIPVETDLEADARDVLEPGELGYWPTGNAFCIFWGKTPASRGDEIRAASAVNIVGKVTSDLSQLWDVADGADVSIEHR